MSAETKQNPKQKGKAVKVGAEAYDLLVQEALRLGVQRGEIITMQQVVEEQIFANLRGKPKPELKE